MVAAREAVEQAWSSGRPYAVCGLPAMGCYPSQVNTYLGLSAGVQSRGPRMAVGWIGSPASTNATARS